MTAMLAAAWIAFACMAIVALMARRRGKKIDKLMAEYHKRQIPD